jgi:hypothetical protein
VIGKIEAGIHDVIQWVINNIWHPLYNFIQSAINWIEKYGLFVYDVITHPEKLLAILGHYLLLAWLDILRRWATPIVRFIVHQLRRFEPDLISILEDVIHKML